MFFKNIMFMFNCKGVRSKEGSIVTSEMVKAKHFSLQSSDLAGKPAIQIRADYEEHDIKSHPWFEEKWPPSVMLTMVFPHVLFLRHEFRITGIEEANMLFAGMVHPPYKGQKEVQGARYVDFSKERREQNIITWEGFRLQELILY